MTIRRIEAAGMIATLILAAFTVQAILFPVRVQACGSYSYNHQNSVGKSVYDYSKQQYTTVNFINYTYSDGCGDYEWLSWVSVADGTPAKLTEFITWWWPSSGQCGLLETDRYSQQASASSGSVWSAAAFEGSCGSHDSHTGGSSAYSLNFSPNTVSATVYS
jgi:hypothetical protein